MSGTSEARPLVPAVRRSRGRTAAVYGVLVVSGLLLLLSSFAVWVNRVALNTDVFVDTSAELLEDDAIRRTVAQRAVDELYASVDVKELFEEQAPDNLDSLSGLAAAGARQALYEILDRALRQPALQRLWEASIRQSHRTLVAVLEGNGRTVSARGGVVTLDLRQIVLEAAERAGIGEQVEERLPADAGRIEVLRSDELDTAQDAFQLLKTLAWLLPLLTVATFALAVWIAPDRRRAFRGIGVTTIVVGAVGLVAAGLVGSYVVDSLTGDAETREAAGNAWDILTELLRSSFRWLIVVGAVFVLGSWLAGPGRRALAVRGALAPVLRRRAWAYTGLAITGLILLVTEPASDFARLLVVAVLVLLGALWIELLRTQTLHEFPDATGAVVLDAVRTRFTGWWESRRAAVVRAASPRAESSAPPAGDLAAQLAALGDLHARGELTDEEFAAAKARVLAGS